MNGSKRERGYEWKTEKEYDGNSDSKLECVWERVNVCRWVTDNLFERELYNVKEIVPLCTSNYIMCIIHQYNPINSICAVMYLKLSMYLKLFHVG